MQLPPSACGLRRTGRPTGAEKGGRPGGENLRAGIARRRRGAEKGVKAKGTIVSR
jgi:hypothetical protein